MSPPPEDRRALYLRWRPLTFADVVGQDHVVRTLRNAVMAGAPSHAYLLAGPRGTGKTSVARILYRAVNCAEPREGDPCGECESCRIALAGRAMDLVEIDAASNRGIDDVRELREKVAFSPSEGRYRVYIVDEAHELTAPAWDAFLKTLEEPPPHALFVLATTEAHKIPSTIVSRCQRFDFRRIKPGAIAERLREIAADEGLQMEPGAAERLARMARGGLRDAISLLDQAASFSDGRVNLNGLREALGLADPRMTDELVESIVRRDPSRALELLVEGVASGADLRLLADDLATKLRGLLFARAGATRALAGDLSEDEINWLTTIARESDPEAASRLVGAISDGLVRIRDGGQFQLHLELAVLEACTAAEASGQDPTVSTNSAAPMAPRLASATRAPSPAKSSSPGPESPDAELLAARMPPESPAGGTEVNPVRNANGGADKAPAVGLDSAPEVGGAGLSAVRQNWPQVIDWVASQNSFVANYLRPAELRELEDNCLVLTFAYKVHFERVADNRNRALVEQACEQVLGQRLRLRCEHVAPTVGSAPLELDLDDPLLKFALERFGGRAELLEE